MAEVNIGALIECMRPEIEKALDKVVTEAMVGLEIIDPRDLFRLFRRKIAEHSEDWCSVPDHLMRCDSKYGVNKLKNKGSRSDPISRLIAELEKQERRFIARRR